MGQAAGAYPNCLNDSFNAQANRPGMPAIGQAPGERHTGPEGHVPLSVLLLQKMNDGSGP